ncbi:phosphatidylinositol-specific phospholipase C1-like protein [Puniceicoccaceae bacterium K14]|nr:phosphatidylinositol-specific phospholipase C1-like protein [Puniceicoccaceae bacterium K14]
MKFLTIQYFAVFISLLTSSLAGQESPKSIRLNQVQVIGTHNSYHIAPSKAVLEYISTGDPEKVKSLDYTHRSLTEQFSKLGIRQVELDLFADPNGGLYAEPFGVTIDSEEHPFGTILQQPGLKVLHIQDIDYRTNVPTFTQALQEIQHWSRANPGHYPIMILLELKDKPIGHQYTQPITFGKTEINTVDKEILSVFSPDEILKPDDIRGKLDTLRNAVTNEGWPILEEVRNKVIFAIDNTNHIRDLYLEDHPSLKGRIAFVSVGEDHPAAAFMKINNVHKDFEKIRDMASKGFLVRTRADSGTRESRNNDVTTFQKALQSGAHFISTDYPEADLRFSDYQVRFQDNLTARANPVTGKDFDNSQDFDPVTGGR